MFCLCRLTFILVVLCATVPLGIFGIKCYTCYEESCPKPWNPNNIEKVSSPSDWCLTYSRDNQTDESVYARYWAMPGQCTENKCKWRTNPINVSFYSCCCNTDLCNGPSGEITKTPTTSKYGQTTFQYQYLIGRIPSNTRQMSLFLGVNIQNPTLLNIDNIPTKSYCLIDDIRPNIFKNT